MKPSARNTITRVAFVVVAGGLAYLLGWSQEPPPYAGRAGQNNGSIPSRTVASNIDPAKMAAFNSYYFMLIDLLKQNREQGLAELAKLAATPATQFTYAKVFELWIRENPRMALDAAATAYGLPPGGNRTAALQAVLMTWGEIAPKDMLDWAGSLAATDQGLLKDALNEVINKDNNPDLAAGHVDQLTDLTTRNEFIGTIATALANKDPVSALDWLNTVATGTTYDTNVKNLMRNLAKKNPVAAAALMSNITEPDVQAAAISTLASAWGAKDPQAALTWINSLPNSEVSTRNASLSSIISGWAKTSPADALAYVQNSPDPSVYLDADPAIASSLSKTDPQAALNWANSLPDGSAKDQALNNVLINSAATDFNSTWNYAASLPSGNGRDLAMANLVGIQAQKDPVQAVALIGQIPAGSAQLNATGKLAAAWAMKDPNALILWTSTLPLGSQHDTAISAAIKAVQTSKLPRGQRNVLAQRLQRNSN